MTWFQNVLCKDMSRCKKIIFSLVILCVVIIVAVSSAVSLSRSDIFKGVAAEVQYKKYTKVKDLMGIAHDKDVSVIGFVSSDNHDSLGYDFRLSNTPCGLKGTKSEVSVRVHIPDVLFKSLDLSGYDIKNKGLKSKSSSDSVFGDCSLYMFDGHWNVNAQCLTLRGIHRMTCYIPEYNTLSHRVCGNDSLFTCMVNEASWVRTCAYWKSAGVYSLNGYMPNGIGYDISQLIDTYMTNDSNIMHLTSKLQNEINEYQKRVEGDIYYLNKTLTTESFMEQSNEYYDSLKKDYTELYSLLCSIAYDFQLN